jgi:hypothetical protein
MNASNPEAKAFLTELEPHYKAALAEAAELFKALPVGTRKAFEKKGVKAPQANPLFTEIYDKETEEATGEIFFKFAMRASGEYKKGPKQGQRWNRKPTIFDAKGKRMTKLPSIWGGTIGKVAFEAVPYFIPGTAAAGLRLALVGVQIIDLVAGGERSAKDLGFGAEDGYEHSDTDGPFEDESATKDTEDGSGDF